MKNWDSKNFHSEAITGDRRFRYVPFHKLSSEDQQNVKRVYVNRSPKAKYDFVFEHYFYPINKAGRFPMKTRAPRELAIPKAKIDDDKYMKSLGYEINPEWVEQHSKQASAEKDYVMRKDLRKRLVRVARVLEKLGADNHPIIYTYEQYDELTDEQKEAWNGYHYKMTYGVVTEESAQEGDYADQGWVEEGSDAYESLDDVLSASEVESHNWLEWSSSQPGPNDWINSEEEQDMYSGDHTIYDLWIYRGDGQPLSKEEMAYISKALGVRM